MNSLRLDGKTALVTGGSGLLGSAVALLLGRRGADVYCGDVADSPTADRTTDVQLRRIDLDVSSEDSVKRCFAEHGPFDVVVNAAAPLGLLAQERAVPDVDMEVHDRILEVTYRGALLVTREAFGFMSDRLGGSIVNIASIHALASDGSFVAYPAAKAAMLALTRATADQGGACFIRCNAVLPGAVPGPEVSESVLSERIWRQSIPRAGQPLDVAELVAFLASDAAAFITGQAIAVDGGVLNRLPRPRSD